MNYRINIPELKKIIIIMKKKKFILFFLHWNLPGKLRIVYYRTFYLVACPAFMFCGHMDLGTISTMWSCNKLWLHGDMIIQLCAVQ